jgi:hypothetical protein
MVPYQARAKAVRVYKNPSISPKNHDKKPPMTAAMAFSQNKPVDMMMFLPCLLLIA